MSNLITKVRSRFRHHHDPRQSPTPISVTSSPLEVCELLEIIFHWGVLQAAQQGGPTRTPGKGVISGIRQLLTFSTVNSLWRNAASAPQLWGLLCSPWLDVAVLEQVCKKAGDTNPNRTLTFLDGGLCRRSFPIVMMAAAKDKIFDVCVSMDDMPHLVKDSDPVLRFLRAPYRALKSLTLELPHNFSPCPASMPLVIVSTVRLRYLRLINCPVIPPLSSRTLTTLCIESTSWDEQDMFHLGLDYVAGWLTFCASLTSLQSLELAGVVYKSLSDSDYDSFDRLPPSLKQIVFRGDPESVRWFRRHAIPWHCSVKLEFIGRFFRPPAEQLSDTFAWTTALFDPGSQLKTIGLGFNVLPDRDILRREDIKPFCTVELVTEIHEVTISLSAVHLDERAKSDRFEEVLKCITEQVKAHPEGLTIGPDTWLALDIPTQDPEIAKRYALTLRRFLQALNAIESLHIANFERRFAEHRTYTTRMAQKLKVPPYSFPSLDALVSAQQIYKDIPYILPKYWSSDFRKHSCDGLPHQIPFDPYEAIGLFDSRDAALRTKLTPLLLPSLRRVRFSSLGDTRAHPAKLWAVADFVYHRIARACNHDPLRTLEFQVAENR
ncbi:hypothetical protein FA13DRAFT_1717515 [Coprinellus micaceus]|uniref:Uncharacterized protein n=1 Tax=Coprinellus micaceus TaxID=71717 RepID=A0A4Y7SGC4_COPMI|nr:hypothetical protein FA13DRAFT_1717515 [Coprinellus micaceus]